MTYPLVHFVLFQIVWCGCVLGPTYGLPLIGAVPLTLLLAVHLKRVEAPLRSLRYTAVAATLGTAAEWAMQRGEVYGFSPEVAAHGFTLVWLGMLWIAFATCFEATLAWAIGRPVVLFLLGAIGGPLSFSAGVRLGAVVLPETQVWSYAVLSAVWAVAMPVCAWLCKRLGSTTAGTTRGRRDSKPGTQASAA